MKKKILRNLLAVALGLMLSSSVVGVFGIAASGATDAYGFDSEWRLRVNSSVPLDLSISDLAALPRTVVYAELYCYGNLVVSGDWAGVNLWLLLETAGANLQADSVEFHASDGYTITFSIGEAQREDVIIAYERDGQPLSEVLRLVVPGANGNVWIAWITEITVVGLGPVQVTPQSSSNSSSPQEPSAPQESPKSQPSTTPQPKTITQPEPATEPVLTPQQPENQSAAQPAVPSSNSQSVPQLDSGSGLPLGYDFAVVGVFVAVLVVMTGYLAWKRKKTS